MVFDDDFTTVSHLKLRTVPTNWPELFENSRECVTNETYHLKDEWTNPKMTYRMTRLVLRKARELHKTREQKLPKTREHVRFGILLKGMVLALIIVSV
jgi:hypothetical protein